MFIRLLCFTLLCSPCVVSLASDPRHEIFVAGRSSDNVVHIDLTTGKTSVIATLPKGSQPSWLVENAQGRLFVGLRGKAKNIVELVPKADPQPGEEFTPTDVTPQIGKYGPGMLAFDSQGRLYVAGDSERVVHRYDVTKRALLDSLDTTRGVNVVGLVIQDDVLFLAEYFQKSILRINLVADPLLSEPLVSRSPQLTRPVGMSLGHNQQLLVLDVDRDAVQEFDAETGGFIATRFHASDFGTKHLHGLIYSKALARYFVATDDVVLELQIDGRIVARHQSPDLREPAGMVIRALTKE